MNAFPPATVPLSRCPIRTRKARDIEYIANIIGIGEEVGEDPPLVLCVARFQKRKPYPSAHSFSATISVNHGLPPPTPAFQTSPKAILICCSDLSFSIISTEKLPMSGGAVVVTSARKMAAMCVYKRRERKEHAIRKEVEQRKKR